MTDEQELRDRLNSSENLSKNEQVLRDRLNGRLTTLDIAGHTFFVDHRMQAIRPKDDFSTQGIRFDELDYYFNDELGRYEIPYDKKKHEVANVDMDSITEIPEHVLVVAFPSPEIMDPVGYSRFSGWDLEDTLEDTPQKSHFTAIILKGKNSYLEACVKENRQQKNLPPLKQKRDSKNIGR